MGGRNLLALTLYFTAQIIDCVTIETLSCFLINDVIIKFVFVTRDNGTLINMIHDGDSLRTVASIDQLRALLKRQPDSGQTDTHKSFSEEMKMLGAAEDFFIRLIAVKQ